jgi:hypothetical protein
MFIPRGAVPSRVHTKISLHQRGYFPKVAHSIESVGDEKSVTLDTFIIDSCFGFLTYWRFTQDGQSV